MNRADLLCVVGALVAGGASAAAALPRGGATPTSPPPVHAALSRPEASAPRANEAPRAGRPPGGSADTARCPPLAPPMPVVMKIAGVEPAPVPIDDPTGEALAPFYAKLAALLRGGRADHLRIGFYADSNGTKDFMTGAMRRWLQGERGDAGHGWIALGKPWDWYIHRDVRHGVDRSMWTSYVVSSRPADDPYYGHGLIAAEARLGGAVSWVASAAPGSPLGQTFSRVELYYLKQPKGGPFDVKIDGQVRTTVETAGPSPEPAFLPYDLPDAPHRIEIVSRTDHPVRMLGATLERPGASVVLDTLSVGAASWRTMLREDPLLDGITLRHRGYDLFILHMGTNTWEGEPRRELTMRKVIAHLQGAIPGVPILVLSPPDHLEDWKVMTHVAPEQRKVARETGAAFYDFHAAMGGAHSMRAFWNAKMAASDLVHFNELGGAFMGSRVLRALFEDFAGWLKRTPLAGCDARATPTIAGGPVRTPQ